MSVAIPILCPNRSTSRILYTAYHSSVPYVCSYCSLRKDARHEYPYGLVSYTTKTHHCACSTATVSMSFSRLARYVSISSSERRHSSSAYSIASWSRPTPMKTSSCRRSPHSSLTKSSRRMRSYSPGLVAKNSFICSSSSTLAHQRPAS